VEVKFCPSPLTQAVAVNTVTCYLSSRVRSRYYKYACIDLSKFMRKVEHGDCQMIDVMQNDMVAKCITVSNTHDDFYAFHLPEHQVEPY